MSLVGVPPTGEGERPGSARHVGASRAKRKNALRQLLSYGANGLLSAAVYSVVVWTLIGLSRKTFELDVLAAYGASVLCNYVGARVIFRPATNLRGHVVRYLTVLVGNFATTALLALLFHRADLPDFFGAYLPVVITAIPTFVLLRTWVFGHSGGTESRTAVS